MCSRWKAHQSMRGPHRIGFSRPPSQIGTQPMRSLRCFRCGTHLRFSNCSSTRPRVGRRRLLLYITAMTCSQERGQATHGIEAFRLLAGSTREIRTPTSLGLDVWLSHIRPLTGACREFTTADIHDVSAAIEQLELWIATASPAVAARFPTVPVHADALRLLPTNLRGSLALCRGMASNPSANYKALRDHEGAAFAEVLRGISPDKKLLLWAHWSHLTYDDLVAGLSVGEDLRQRLGAR